MKKPLISIKIIVCPVFFFKHQYQLLQSSQFPAAKATAVGMLQEALCNINGR
jgi:CRISPR/Cas system-associated protein Cas5 (RAMP superfamily)